MRSGLSTIASEVDNISAHAIRLVKDKISPVLAHIVNTIFLTGIFPHKMKIAKVIPIFQSKDRQKYKILGQYLYSPFKQILEKLVIRLGAYLEKHNILTDVQFGFHKGYSTSTAVETFVDAVRKFRDTGYLAAGVFIDFVKAFESLNHLIPKTKLEGYGINGIPLTLIVNYLKIDNKQFKLAIHNQKLKR